MIERESEAAMDIAEKRSGQSGSKEYPSEGYLVKWDGEGLEIEVIDYHAGTLRLGWKEVMALAGKGVPLKKRTQKYKILERLKAGRRA
jgi:hypothetical protein